LKHRVHIELDDRDPTQCLSQFRPPKATIAENF
jgi:hypothetical protein